ncbi:hypothetical protein GO283_02662 [Ralstonia solanacearum]|uniref:Uncharacterized protein n=2 Tax=Ralstonia solanacearum species complex TaxID=3116862 RepID=A0A0S4UCR1_RALSL|nr:hypothetical protein RSOE_23785 [Ralstonia solanacearum OE1-1]NJZ69112.1 hypothetical protein [Ralstonia solanacearum]TXD69408.1 hypothetical protein FUT89_26170 [Ralstonia pseudosolanacearum]NJZ78740.1 hypothetical protein [Ralstonia solanacearum]NKA03568.1 hypothetical protein [Ralstonia solanacearum]
MLLVLLVLVLDDELSLLLEVELLLALCRAENRSCVSFCMSWPTVELLLSSLSPSSPGGGGGMPPGGGGGAEALVVLLVPVVLLVLSVDEADEVDDVDEVDKPSWLSACSIACMKPPPP